MSFSFGFSGDDIEASEEFTSAPQPQTSTPATTAAGAFPVPGKPQLPPAHHPLDDLLSQLPSKIAYSCLEITLDDGSVVRLPRRELWDVRVQLMAEDDGGDENMEGLGASDVKTGVYEGGFKSWESSVDLVKVLAASNAEGIFEQGNASATVVELGCGTALPSLALFQTALKRDPETYNPFHLALADYNPSVLLLVTLPNILLTWALHAQPTIPVLKEAFNLEVDDDISNGELELSAELFSAFSSALAEQSISLTFMSGAWSETFVNLLYAHTPLPSPALTMVLGSETIYSPFALETFTETIFTMLRTEKSRATKGVVYVAAKKLYFGVGGSLDDFISKAQERGALVKSVREETEGVRRGVVRCSLENNEDPACP